MPDEPMCLLRPFGRPRWPWRVVTTTTRGVPPLFTWIRRPRQVLGIHLRLPDEHVDGRRVHHGLSVLWGRPDVRAYPLDFVPYRAPESRWQ